MTENLENSAERTQLELAREVGNVWTFEGREMEMFVAEGKASVGVDVLDRASQQPSGATVIHNFGWDRKDPFIIREQSLKTKLKSVGRQTRREVDQTSVVAPNARLYEAIVQSGEQILQGLDDQPQIESLSRSQMLEMAKNYPEFASEAIESWLEGWHFEVITEDKGSLDWIFAAPTVVKVFGWIGLRSIPDAACILTFTAPTASKREKYEEEVQKINSDQVGELKIAEVSESFIRKLQYGEQHLQSVEGVAVGAPGIAYSDKLKEDFITLFSPLAFVEAVEKMHESFSFTKGKAARS